MAKVGDWMLLDDTLVPLEREQGLSLPPTSDEKWGG